MVELNSLMNEMAIYIMKRYWTNSILRELLKREPTTLEIIQYENEVFYRDLAKWRQDRLEASQKIHDFVWGKEEKDTRNS